jgi:RNA 2',3'-cyclic 3'-phosphodiesterase
MWLIYAWPGDRRQSGKRAPVCKMPRCVVGMPTETLRLFTGLWPEGPLRAAIARWQGQWEWPQRASIVKADRLHLTLHFLGDIDASMLPALVKMLRVPFEPFQLEFGHAGVWPNGVAVLEPHSKPPQLLELHERVGAALATLDIPLDTRPYRPHITLARRAFGARAPQQGPGLHWRAESGFVIVRSMPGGAGYQVIERFR